MINRNIVCTVCPVGCEIHVFGKDKNDLSVEGNKCKRGKAYSINEVIQPKRVLTSTVVVKNGKLKRLPVKSKGYIPKKYIFDAMRIINDITVTAPVSMGDVIINNILGLGIDVISCRNIEAE